MATSANAGRRILVVDDYPLVCDSIRRMLAVDGHQVEAAASGEAALDLFQKGGFDLVITDYKLPVMCGDKLNGDKLASAIKALAPKQPVAVITACAEWLQSSGAPLANVDLVISKPFGLQELRQAVNLLLARRVSCAKSGNRQAARLKQSIGTSRASRPPVYQSSMDQ